LYYPRLVIVKAAAWQAGGGFVTAFDVRGTNAAVQDRARCCSLPPVCSGAC
jgi:hypothetical protein